MKVYILIKRTSDGYDDNTSWLKGVYSDKEVANKERAALEGAEGLLAQQIKEADKREEDFWAKWEDSLRDEYAVKGLSEDELTEKYYKLESEARGGVQDYLWDEYVNYKVIELKVDSDNGLIIL